MKKNIRIIAVDARDQARRAMAKAVKSEPRIEIVDQAKSGYEAITKTLRLQPDVVLMNTGMESRMAGIFACKEICAVVPCAKVILCDEDGSRDIVRKAFQMGAANLLVTGYTEAELVNAILDAADGKASIHYSSAVPLREEFKHLLDLQDNLVYVLNVVTRLTPAELNILRLLYNGMRYLEIEKVLFISTSTMKTHVSHILKKFNLESTAQVVEVLHSTELFSIITATNGNAIDN